MDGEIGPGEISVTTKPCGFCGETATIVVPKDGYERWCAGEKIQNALPEVDPAIRELLISGTHPACWDKHMKDPYGDAGPSLDS